MSLLKWKKLAKQKKELGNKINFVHDTILKKQLGDKISQESFQKVFKPITTKIDNVASKKIRGEKLGVPDYGLEDEDEGLVPDDQKQIEPNPPTYEESLNNIFGENVPPLKKKTDSASDDEDSTSDDEDSISDDEDSTSDDEDSTLDDEKIANEMLDRMELLNYNDIEKQLGRPEMPKKKIQPFLQKQLDKAILKRYKLNGHNTQVLLAFNRGRISEEEKKLEGERIDEIRGILNPYITFLTNKVEMKKGSGLKKRGGNIVFFNDVKQLLKKLELIVGEILAGNTSIEMRNTGVAILDILLKTSNINKAQYEKLYKTYFKI